MQIVKSEKWITSYCSGAENDYKENKTHYETIVFAFRGTEPKQLADFETDIDQITFGIKTHSKLITPSNSQTVKPDFATSFNTGLEWVDKVNETYQPTYVHATGHSKGGAEADYVASNGILCNYMGCTKSLSFAKS